MTVAEEIKRMQHWRSDEPVFVIRAQDVFGARAVMLWLSLYMTETAHREKPEMIATMLKKAVSALATAKAMQMWPTKKVPD